jgi:hypothetical protein
MLVQRRRSGPAIAKKERCIRLTKALSALHLHHRALLPPPWCRKQWMVRWSRSTKGPARLRPVQPNPQAAPDLITLRQLRNIHPACPDPPARTAGTDEIGSFFTWRKTRVRLPKLARSENTPKRAGIKTRKIINNNGDYLVDCSVCWSESYKATFCRDSCDQNPPAHGPEKTPECSAA